MKKVFFNNLKIFVLIYWFPFFLGLGNTLVGEIRSTASYGNQGCYLNEEEKSILLKVGREVLESIVLYGTIPDFGPKVANLSQEFGKKTGVFVTLKKGGELRGCIGNVLGYQTVFEAVIRNTINSAIKDTRFYPVNKEELGDVEIEISILSAIKRINTLEEFDNGHHGIIMRKGNATALFLPQVAVEQKWSKYETLNNLCLKAGLSPDVWRDSDVEIFVFTAEVFKEGDFIKR